MHDIIKERAKKEALAHSKSAKLEGYLYESFMKGVDFSLTEGFVLPDMDEGIDITTIKRKPLQFEIAHYKTCPILDYNVFPLLELLRKLPVELRTEDLSFIYTDLEQWYHDQEKNIPWVYTENEGWSSAGETVFDYDQGEKWLNQTENPIESDK